MTRPKFAALVAMLAVSALVGQPAVEAAMREAAPERDFRAIIDQVRQAISQRVNAGKPPGDQRYICMEAIYSDRAVVELDGKYFQYPYRFEVQGESEVLVLGDPVEVAEQYVPVKTLVAVAATTANMTEAADGSIAVTLIRAGQSGNSNYYPDATLREAAALFEGVRVFAKSDADHTKGVGKDVRGLIGGIYDVRFVEGKASDGPDSGALVGTFKAIDPADVVVVKMTEAVKRGMQNLMGLSIDATARTKVRMEGTRRLREAVKFTKVHSVDLIVEPGAGGGLDRLTEAAEPQPLTINSGEKTMPLWKQRLLEAIAAKDATKRAAINVDTISDDDLVRLHEAICGQAAAVAGDDPARMPEAQAPVTRAEFEMLKVRQTAQAAIALAKLPQVTRDKLSTQFSKLERFTEADVTTAIADEGAYLARITESGAVRVPAFGAGSIQVGDRSVLMKDMLDAFFDPSHKDHRRVSSFREAYVELTGDRQVTGELRYCDLGRMAESLGTFRESIGSGTLANALGDSITRRMQAVFTGLTNLDAWRKVVRVVPVNDFRSQERFRVGGYGNLPGVAQGAGYTALASPGDNKATYAVTKRGGTEDVTLEAIANDDVGALRAIPNELALAAKNTLFEFAFDFYRTNPVTYDTLALYHATHNNLFTGALTAAEFSLHRLGMAKQTRAGSGKRLGVTPAAVLVPFELQETAYNLFVRGQNLDKTFVQTINPEVIPVSYWTDPNDWCTLADPNVMPVVEMGFYQGREEPELFVQDAPNMGSMFSNDKLTYKIRHIYGGQVLVDGEKATTKAVVP